MFLIAIIVVPVVVLALVLVIRGDKGSLEHKAHVEQRLCKLSNK